MILIPGVLIHLVHFDDHPSSIIEIDHHDPRKKDKYIQSYLNLFPSHSHCNLSKGDYWPNKEQSRNEQRLLNPRKETDYNEQIVECIETGELIGLTTPARFHIYKLELNDPSFCKLRLRRTQINELFQTPVIANAKHSWNELQQDLPSLILLLTDFQRTNIPKIKAATAEQTSHAVDKRQIKGPLV